MAESRIIRIRLKEEQFRKYKVFCAIYDISMTDQTNKIVRDFIDKESEIIKIIKTDKIVRDFKESEIIKIIKTEKDVK